MKANWIAMQFLVRTVILLASLSGIAFAQSPPGFITGQTLTAAQLNAAFATKQNYPVQTGSNSLLGILQADGTTINAANGLISCVTATIGQIGCVKPDGTTITINNGVLSSLTAGGNVSNSGTPTTGQIAAWIDSTHIQGLSTIPVANLPIATLSVFGLSQPDGISLTVNGGVLSVIPAVMIGSSINGACPLGYNLYNNSGTVDCQANGGGGGGGTGTVTSIAGACGSFTQPNPVTVAGTIFILEPVNSQTGTTYALQGSDCGALVTIKNASSIAVSLAQAGSIGFPPGWYVDIFNAGAGTATVTPATSTINSASTLVLGAGIGTRIVSDGTNYQVTNTPVASSLAPANPTATAGPTAVNGSASTYMRSDGAPAVQLATAAQKGVVQGDGSTLPITSGVMACATATTSQLGCVKPDGSSITISAGVISASGGGGGGGNSVINIYTSGSGTWTKPISGITTVQIFGCGGGGSGGSGALVASSFAGSGGGGGGGGDCHWVSFQASDVPSTVSYSIPAAATGGTAKTGSVAPGGNGATGGNVTFGSLHTWFGGGPGIGGNNFSGTIGPGGSAGGQFGAATNANSFCTIGTITSIGGSGGSTAGATSGSQAARCSSGGGGSSSAGTAGSVSGYSNEGASGGGGGGGLTASPASSAGGNSGQSIGCISSGGAIGGIANGSTPSATTNDFPYHPGCGGAGGGSNSGATGIVAASGGLSSGPGGGGGGGGAALGGASPSNTSGAGGNGGPGVLMIISF